MFSLGQLEKYLNDHPGTVPDKQATMNDARKMAHDGSMLVAACAATLVGEAAAAEFLELAGGHMDYLRIGIEEMQQAQRDPAVEDVAARLLYKYGVDPQFRDDPEPDLSEVPESRRGELMEEILFSRKLGDALREEKH